MRTRYDEYRIALEQALGRIAVDPDSSVQDVVALIAAVEDEARRDVATFWLAEARERRDTAAQAAHDATAREAAAERAAQAARKALSRVDGGDAVDPAGEYWVLDHPVGAFAFARDRAQENDFGVAWHPPVIAGRRTGRRSVRGAELPTVQDLVAVVADHQAARTALLELAARPIGAAAD